MHDFEYFDFEFHAMESFAKYVNRNVLWHCLIISWKTLVKIMTPSVPERWSCQRSNHYCKNSMIKIFHHSSWFICTTLQVLPSMVCGSSKVSGGSDQSHIYSGKLKKKYGIVPLRFYLQAWWIYIMIVVV